MVRLGFIGAGFMGQLAHLHSYRQLDGCQIVALAEAKPELGRKVAARFDIKRLYGSHRQLLEDDGVDAVIVSQPYHHNVELGRQVLESGRHLFTEKPMAARLEDAQLLVDLARSRNLRYACGFMKRYDPGVRLARRKLDELREGGGLGRLRMIDAACFLGDWLENPGQPIRSDEPAAAEPITPRYPAFLPESRRDLYDHFLNIYSHTINLLRFLLPGHDLKCVSAHHQDRGFLVVLRAGDVLVSLRGVPSAAPKWQEWATFQFEKGRVHLDLPTPLNRQKVADVTVLQPDGDGWIEQRMVAPVRWAFLEQARAFIEAIEAGRGPAAEGQACLPDVALMESIFQKLE
ncbi:MAG: Gfo/Idh/MocA family oxidoreductase [Phycisphaeraceae bacterium]|nr:Gfo/Idh/MocA family oxidoreductase [Phycisphaeraceae bacterium]